MPTPSIHATPPFALTAADRAKLARNGLLSVAPKLEREAPPVINRALAAKAGATFPEPAAPEPRVYQHFDKSRLAELAADYAAGMIFEALEAKYGVSASTIRLHLKKAGLYRQRDHGGAHHWKAHRRPRRLSFATIRKEGREIPAK